MQAWARLLPLALSVLAGESSGQGWNRVRVAQDASGDFQGADERALRAGLRALAPGGVLEIGAGRYVLRQDLLVRGGVSLRGEPGAVLALPAATLLAEAAEADATVLRLESTAALVVGTRVGIHPPAGEEFFADGVSRVVPLRTISGVDERTVTFEEPLPFALPARSRLGYVNRILRLGGGGIRVEGLEFDGARGEIPMPGHQWRTGVWISGKPELPVEDVSLRKCVFRNFHGRGIAVYAGKNVRIEDCLFEDCAEEAVELDHYTHASSVVGNRIRRVDMGIVLNDAYDSLVELNTIEDCRIGLAIWRHANTPAEGVNTGNVLRHNVVRRASAHAITLETDCHANTVEYNVVQGGIRVIEPSNRVRRNLELR